MSSPKNPAGQNLLQQGKIRKLQHKPNFTLPVRIVNERITHDCRPLLPFITTDGRFPNVQGCWPIVTRAAQQPYLAKIDLKKAFHSIPLADDQIGAYAFELEGSYYAYTTMPMGATNAPKHFHGVMGILLSKLPFAHDIRYYQNDIFVAASDPQQLKRRYQQTIDYLAKQNFQINTEKSQLNCTDLLGYTLNNHTLSIPDQKWKRVGCASICRLSSSLWLGS
ncbi:putative RNA-directed DNA polymerase [Gregarina niphandrodes]|uniref:RNA-directed DNA polymerase n=1 Tax=Gregarina niphandrodes TaxID=110365 RepID=A0A023AWK1_GRENI|nr:putative RNA-directed DNA polymerase [Gregarina niphandrodes]EZG43126.1 putative RNA-directed DNA polymerase [Gregarina niphandrodes]|eukprot:XP_011133617.1 putative RNA-directed DNA polymerase [Gregarina niphandrodes]